MNSYKSTIKKNIIDLLMFSLYADARTIYREYVQNALDAIYRAVNEGILNQLKDGIVNITIDKNHKRITILDNGCGISVKEAQIRMLDISASSKDGITAAGQFGIGRLVGGGYCHKLIFKTSAKGEDKATIVTFDIDAIWHMVKEDPKEYLATQVIDDCTTVEYVTEESDHHYFEVNIYDVKTENANILLDKNEIVSYLNSIAPVEYKPEFNSNLIHKSTVLFPDFKELHTNLAKVQVFVNSIRIQKQYGLTVVGSKSDKIENLEYFKIEDSDYGLLGWGWFALTKFTVQIDKSDTLSCIRLRKHNIQIGDFNTLSGRPLWKEERGNSYFYGEFFITHKNIVPNAARDGLAPTHEKIALFYHLTNYFKKLTDIYSKANKAKKAIDKIVEGAKRIETDKKVDRFTRDLIENKGISFFLKLLNNARSGSLQRMINLYIPEFEEAKKMVENAKAALIPVSKSKDASNPSTDKPDIDPEVGATSYTDDQRLSTDSGSSNYSGKYNDKNYQITSPDIDITTSSSKDNTHPSQQNTIQRSSLELETSEREQADELKPSLTPLIRQKDIISTLESILDDNEIWLLRRVFKVLNTFCPNNERDQRLISNLEMQIIKELKNV